jgi:hypothetical protein
MTVDEAIIKQETLDFLQVAERYCVFVETETTKGIEYHFKARDMLTTLYATAIRFPEVAITSDKEFNNRVSRPEIGLHELTCKQDEKIRKNSSGTRGYHCGVFAGRYDLS